MSKITAPTEQELQGLSDEEREALNDPDEQADLEALAGEDDDKDDDAGKDKDGDDKDDKSDKDGGGDEDEKDGDADADKDDKADKDAKDGKDDKDGDDKDGSDADKDAGATDSATDEVFVPRYTVKEPEKYEERMQGFESAKAELQKKFADGDINMEEMLAERDKIDAQRTELREQKLKADMAREQDQQAQEQRWFWEVDRFIRDVKKDDGIDLRDKALNKSFDMFVKTLAADEENKDKSSEWFLTEAYEMVRARHRLAPANGGDSSQPKSEADKKALEEAARKRGTDPKKIPKTLGTVPAAGGEQDSDSEFADLDKLEGLELETALARLPKDRADRYLAMQ